MAKIKMRIFLRKVFLNFENLIKPWDYKRSAFSDVISMNAVDLETRWREFNNKFHPFPQVFQFGRAACKTEILFHHEVVGKSKIEIKIHIKAEYFPENFLLQLFKLPAIKHTDRELFRILEFMEYLKGTEFHEAYLELQKNKKPFIAPISFNFKNGLILCQKLPYHLIDLYLPSNLQAKKDSYNKVRVQLILIPIHSINYGLWEEKLTAPTKPELIDIFVEVIEVLPRLKPNPFFIYLGSIYTNREITKICKNLELNRKLLPNHFKKYFSINEKVSGLKDKSTINPLSRIRDYSGAFAITRMIEGSGSIYIQKGMYSLSKYELDHSPIEEIDLLS